MPNWDTVQQFIRILLYMIGGAIFGSEVADGDVYQGAIGGAVSIGAFVWWWVWERRREP